MKAFISLLLYRVVFLLLLPVLLVALLIRSKNHPEYRQRLGERLGFIDNKFNKNGIVLHAASVGEVLALKAFVEKVLKRFPELPLTITTFTPTGSAQVKKLFGDRVQHCYLPIDSIFCTHLFLARLSPKVMVFMETEIWPNLIAQSKSRGAKLLLINGRLSNKSVKSYAKLSALITPALNAFNKVLTQSEVNHDNFLSLGCNEELCELVGNLKFDIAVNNDVLDKKNELSQYVPSDRKLWVVASTHQGDESIALNAFKALNKEYPELLLVIVPRHPERFNDIAELSQSFGYATQKRSSNTPIDNNTSVWVLDSLGELMAMCALAHIVTMGGSFSNIGGHNPLEPALFKKPVIVGNDMSNFTEIMQQLLANNGVIQIADANLLSETVASLYNNTQQLNSVGENAYAVVLQNQGASDKTLAHLAALL